MAWEYPDDELEVLCQACHRALHERRSTFDGFVDAWQLPRVLALVAGYLNRSEFQSDFPQTWDLGRMVGRVDMPWFSSHEAEFDALLAALHGAIASTLKDSLPDDWEHPA